MTTQKKESLELGNNSYWFAMLINFGSNCFRAMRAQIFIFIAFWQNKKKPLANRPRLFTFGAIKLRGVELLIDIWTVLPTGEYRSWIRNTLHLDLPVSDCLPISGRGFRIKNGVRQNHM